MKFMKLWKRAASALLAAVLSVPLAACGGTGDKNRTDGAEEKEYIWVPQFVELDMEKVGYSDIQVIGNSAYSISSSWDPETQANTFFVIEISLEDGSTKSETPLKTEQADGENGNRNVNNFAMDGAGNIWTVESVYHWNETSGSGSQEQFLCRYDSGGNKTAEKNFSEEAGEDSYAQGVAVDGAGRVYVNVSAMGGWGIFLFDSDCSYKGKITSGNDMYINSLGTDREGVMYAVVSDYGAAGGGTSLRELDFDQKAFGKSYADYPGSYSSGRIVPGLEKTSLSHDGSHVYEYDKETQTAENIFNWLDCDIDGEYVRDMAVLEDGRIAVISRDWESSRTELVLLSKTKASEAVQKETIVIGCLYENSRLQGTAVKFNKTSDKYRISIKNYYDYNQVTSDNYQQVLEDSMNRLNNDITSGNGPDILELSGLNMMQLAAKGVFEDLNPYLEKSSVLDKGDFIENILDNFSYQGMLLTIPRSFQLQTIAGKTSEVGPEPGWTLDEMLAYAEQHPGAAVFDYSSKESIMHFLVAYNQSSFVDWETGTCSFDSDTFKNLLKFAAGFPDEFDWNSDDGRSTPTKIADGDILLQREYLYSFDSIQQAEGIFGEPVTFIGYPNNEGTSGCYLQTDGGMLAITSKSANKEGAWAFIERYLTEEWTWMDFGFPVTKKGLQEAREEATKVEYLMDENGNPLLDENGDPIIMNNGNSSVSYEDGWTYTYHVTTEEEADRVMELIDVARPVTDSDQQIMNIITEEAEAFFKNQKSADDVAGIIQRRVQVYVDENR